MSREKILKKNPINYRNVSQKEIYVYRLKINNNRKNSTQKNNLIVRSTYRKFLLDDFIFRTLSDRISL